MTNAEYREKIIAMEPGPELDRLVAEQELYNHMASHVEHWDSLPDRQEMAKLAVGGGYAVRREDGKLFLLCCPNAALGVLV